MNIGIIGTGNMGRTLGLVWAELGHEVFFGVREGPQAEQAASLAHHAKVPPRHGSNQEAARFGDVLLYTPRGISPFEVLGPEHGSLLAGKTVIDIGNQEIPPDFAYPAITCSLAEALARQAPGAHIVKAFNTVPMETFELCPEVIRPYRIAAFVAADDAKSRTIILQLAQEMGFVPVDCGALRQARLLESAADLIRLLNIGQKRPGANFSIPNVPAAEHPRLGGRQASKLK
jgi:predicted dinucleotide-binding enzyme